MPMSKNSSGAYRPNSKIKHTSRLSRSASIRVHVEVWNECVRARDVGAAPEAGARTKLFDREFQFRESHT